MDFIKRHASPILFAVAYAAFMGVSIPKVGAMFLLYSEQHGGSGLVWVIASYGAAVTIDALIGFLTYATTSKRRDWYMQAGIWLFVLILSVYSVYFNWVYDELHSPYANAREVWALPSPLPGWDVQQLTTLLISAVPLGILGFTLIARIIREEKHTVSLDELRQAAANVAERAALQQVIDTANVGRGISWAKARIQAGKAMLNELTPSKEDSGQTGNVESTPIHPIEEVQQALPEKLQKALMFLASTPNGTDEELANYLGLLRPASARFWRLKAIEVTGDSADDQLHNGGALAVEEAASSAEDQPFTRRSSGGALGVEEAEDSPESLERITEHLATVNPHSTANILAEEKADDEEPSGAGNAQMDVSAHLSPGEIWSRGTVSIDDAAKLLGFTPKYVRELRAKGTLKTASRNRNRITIKSINAVLLARQKAIQNGSQTAVIPQLQIISSEQPNGEQNGHRAEVNTDELVAVKPGEKAL